MKQLDHILNKSIHSKLIALINLVEEISNLSNKKEALTLITETVSEQELFDEIKATAKLIVNKSNTASKKIIETTLSQKEEAIALLEISKLRMEAQQKSINTSSSNSQLAPIITKSSFFSNIKNTLFKLLRINYSKKGNNKSELESYDLQKQKIAENFSKIGTEKLKPIQSKTFALLFNTSPEISKKSIENIRAKIKI